MANEYMVTPCGRLVGGDPWTPQDKGYQGQPMVDRQGNPKRQWFVALAIPKGPEWDTLWAQIAAVAQRNFPNGEWQQPGFAWKVRDGDAAEHVGKEGFAGCWILRLTSGFPPNMIVDENNQQIVDPAGLQKGYYIRARIGVDGNGLMGTNAGIYLNIDMLQRLGYGPPIVSGPAPAEVFTQPYALPPGASPTPVAGAPLPAQPVVGPAAGSAPVPGVAPPAVPVPPTPAAGIPAAAPASPVAPAAYPAPPASPAPIVPGQPVQAAPPVGVPPVPGQG